MTNLYTSEKIVAILSVSKHPMSVGELAQCIDPRDPDAAHHRIQLSVRRLRDKGAIIEGPDRFCKGGYWCKTWRIPEPLEVRS